MKILLAIFFLGTLLNPAIAHPVAQGAVDLQILPDKILLQARVSGEEIFIARTFAHPDSPELLELNRVWEQHARYWLDHFKILADGRPIAGRLLQFAAARNDFVLYHFEFPTGAKPRDLRVEENVLREIEFAPGNPWEASYIARIREVDQVVQEGALLSPKQPLVWSSEKASSRAKRNSFYQYLQHGIGHILGGYDHLLFIIALVLAAGTFWDLLKVVTAFTFAHTFTLALSVLNIFRLPSAVVEPMIAASIVFVALTNTFWPRHSRGWTRSLTAFFFGLFHGLGFAGGLISATEGLTQVPVLLAIAAFSLGVEFGHQLIVLPLFTALRLARTCGADQSSHKLFATRLDRAGSLIISAAGLVYLIAALR